MLKTLFLLSASVAVCVVLALQPVALQSPAPASATPAAPASVVAPTQTVANVPVPALTAEEQKAVAALVIAVRRDSSAASQVTQRAVHDVAEGLFREPTAAEAAALAEVTADDAVTEIALPGGGAAIETTPAQMNHVVATRAANGRVAVTHSAESSKGGRRDQ